MITDTTATPTFIEDEPDWAQPIILVRKWSTSIVPNREGGEQRKRRRKAPRFQISYRRQGYTPSELALRRRSINSQVMGSVVVPIWVADQAALSFATNSVTLSSTPANKFKVGSWVYVVSGSNKCFRKITSISSNTINLSTEGADKYPSGFDWSLFSTGIVYPCILGIRVDNSVRIVSSRHDIHAIEISVDEL